jgi:hypothetical protein
MERLGHPSLGRGVYIWLNKVRQHHRLFHYWYQKYSIDGVPEWETPAVDQTAMIPWGLERHYRRTGDRDLVTAVWPMVEQAAQVCRGESGGHPGLRLLDDLHLITSAGSGDQLYGAFLYSNACAVAGLHAAARLATEFGFDDAAESWRRSALRIWNEGILQEVATNRPGAPGLIDPRSGRFLQARRLSKLRGLWTSNPEFLVDSSDTLDINMLGLAVPLGLLPAGDPRLVRIAEEILCLNAALKGDANVLARPSFDPGQTNRSDHSSDQHDVSSLATLWMVRYLIQLGRETGQGRNWVRAVAMLEGILSRLSKLGLVLRAPGRGMESARRVSNPGGTAWRLHAMLIDTLLDLVDLDYDAIGRRLIFRPVLPGQWAQTGIHQLLPCGEVSFLLQRPIGGKVYYLHLESRLKHPVALVVDLTCPGLRELGTWQSSPPTPEPAFDARTGRLTWSLNLPSEETQWNWTWG